MRSRWCIIVRIVCSTIGHTARSLAGAGCGKEIRYKRVTRTTTFLPSSNFNFIHIIRIRTEINLMSLNLVYILITHISVIHDLWKIWTIKTFLPCSFFLFLLLLLFRPLHLPFPSVSPFYLHRCRDPFFFILFHFLYSRHFYLSFYSLRNYPPPNSPRLCDSSFLLLLSLSLVRSIFFSSSFRRRKKEREKVPLSPFRRLPIKERQGFLRNLSAVRQFRRGIVARWHGR